MKKILIIMLVFMLALPCVLAELTPAPNGECYKYEPKVLKTGWNQPMRIHINSLLSRRNWLLRWNKP